MKADAEAPIVIAGTGRALPPAVRTNDDPVFDRLRENPPPGGDIFFGYRERRVLGPDGSLAGLMTAAGRAAMAAAGCAPGDVDLLLGYGSLGRYIAPNDLARVHAELGLPSEATVLPVADEYTVFNSSLVLADSLIRTGRARRALVVCGSNWTSVVDYHSAPSVSAGDGAGAALLEARPRRTTRTGAAALPRTDGEGLFRVVAHRRHTPSDYYGRMFVAPDASGAGRFTITDAGIATIGGFAAREVPEVALRLLAAAGLSGDQVTLLCHQTTQGFLDAWVDAIAPKELLHTLAEYGNMTSASLAVNLDTFAPQITTDFIVLLGIGIQWQVDALLLSRADVPGHPLLSG